MRPTLRETTLTVKCQESGCGHVWETVVEHQTADYRSEAVTFQEECPECRRTGFPWVERIGLTATQPKY